MHLVMNVLMFPLPANEQTFCLGLAKHKAIKAVLHGKDEGQQRYILKCPISR